MNTKNPAPKRRSPKQRRERVKKTRPPEATPDSPWRLFISLPLPHDVRDQVKKIIDHLEPTDLPVRWIDPENGHLTLHFIGETPPEMAELLRMALKAPITPHEPIDLRTAEPGTFPSIRRPRVLWLGLWGPAHRLEALYNDIGDFLDDFGLEIEDADFHPHITLGRVRATEGVKVGSLPDEVRDAFESLRTEHLAGADSPVPFPVTEVQLVRSHLDQDGPQYEVLATYPLEGTDQPEG